MMATVERAPRGGDAAGNDGPADAFAAGHDHGREESGRLARNLGALAGGQMVTWMMTLLWTLVVPRALGPGGFGIIVSAQAINGILSLLLGLGANNYLVREIVVDRGRGPQLVGTAVVMRVLLTPVVGCGAVLWAHLAHYDHETTVVLYLITAMTVLTMLADPLQAAFQAIERMQYMAYANIINKTGQSLIGIALVVTGLRDVGIAANMAALAGLVLLIEVLWLRRYMRVDCRTRARTMADMLRQSAPYLATGFAGMIYFWIDTAMLSLMTNHSVVGWYGAATALFQTLMFLPGIVAGAWLPRLVQAFVAGGRPRLVKTARTPFEIVLLASIPITFGTVMVAHPLIRAVYGPSFSHAAVVMILLGLCVPPMYLNIMLNQILVAAKRQVIWSYFMLAAAVVNPLLNLVLIPLTERHGHNGAIGAALSLLLTEVFMDLAGFVVVGRGVFDRASMWRCARLVAASAAMASAAWLLRSTGEVVALAGGLAVFAVLVAGLKLVTATEVAAARSAAAHVSRRATDVARRANVRRQGRLGSTAGAAAGSD